MLQKTPAGALAAKRLRIDVEFCNCSGSGMRDDLIACFKSALKKAGLPTDKKYTHFATYKDCGFYATATFKFLHVSVRTLLPERDVVGEIMVYSDNQETQTMAQKLFDELAALFQPGDSQS